MNICLTWFTIGVLGEPIYNINRFVLQGNGKIVEFVKFEPIKGL